MNELKSVSIRVPQKVLDRIDAYNNQHPEMTRSAILIDCIINHLPAPESEGKIQMECTISHEALSADDNGATFGKEAGRLLCQRLGELTSPQSNEFLTIRDGKSIRGTVRTARGKSKQFRCYDSVRDRCDIIICAHTSDSKVFEIWEVSKEVWDSISIEYPPHPKRNDLTGVSFKDVKAKGTRLPNINLAK